GADYALGHLAEHLIAAAMAEGVVHKLEIVEIDKKDGDLPAVRSVTRELVGEPFEQQATRGESRERVMSRRLHRLRDRAAQVLDLRIRNASCGRIENCKR